MNRKESLIVDRPRIDELDGLRAILALWVVCCHMLSWSGFFEVTFSKHIEYFWAQFIEGTTAVEIFMILSGFAISFLLNHRSQTYLQFMVGRFFRIYPVYALCLVLGVASTFLVPFILETAQWKSTSYFQMESSHYAAERADMAGQLFWHFTLLNGLVPSRLLPDGTVTFLPPAWSITLEWQYYLVAPFLARMVRSGTGILGLILLAVIGQHFAKEWVNNPGAFLLSQLPLFMIGIGSYHFYEYFCRSAQTRSNVYIFPVLVVVAFAVFSRWHMIALIAWAAVFGCIFVRGDDILSRLLSVLRRLLLHPWLQSLGGMSYTIYLIHWPLILFLLSLLLHWNAALSSHAAGFILFLIGLPLILCASALLHNYVELPAMAFGKKLAYHGRKPRIEPL